MGAEIRLLSTKAAILARIGVDHEAVLAAFGYAHAVIFAVYGGKVKHHQHPLLAAWVAAQVGVHAVGSVIGLYPQQTLWVRVAYVQGGVVAVQLIEVAQQQQHATVIFLLSQVPGQGYVMVPLSVLGKVLAHEQ